jgi:hypothetical protein
MFKFQLVGSCRLQSGLSQDDYADRRDQFIAAGKALGAALAEKGHEIFLGVSTWDLLKDDESLALAALRGASQVGADKLHVVWFYAPWNDIPSGDPDLSCLIDEIQHLPNIELLMKPVGKGTHSFGSRLIPNLNLVDAVILVGGSEGTASIGFAASAMGKPLITVNSLGGSAADLYEDFLSGELLNLAEKGKIHPPYVLNTAWQPDSLASQDPNFAEKNRHTAGKILELADELIKVFAQENRATRRTQWLTLLFSPLLAVAWVVVYVLAYEGHLQPTLAFFGLLFLASLLGTGIRTLIAQRENTAILTGYGVLTDAALSILLAFGLALIYLIGGISFTGSVVVLDSESTDFANIAISMSLLGLAAGAVIPTRQLLERLGGYISPNQ